MGCGESSTNIWQWRPFLVGLGPTSTGCRGSVSEAQVAASGPRESSHNPVADLDATHSSNEEEEDEKDDDSNDDWWFNHWFSIVVACSIVGCSIILWSSMLFWTIKAF